MGYNAYETCSRCDYSTKVEISATGNHSIENGQCSVCGIFEITISFADTTNRTVFTTSQQVWVQNGITVTNNKGDSSSNMGDYTNPVRFYKSSQIIIEYSGMTKIVITCGSSSYATTCKNSIGNSATASDSDVIILFTEATNSFDFTASQGQIQVASIKVYSAQEPCKHTNTALENIKAATCTEKGYTGDTRCLDCNTIIAKGTETNTSSHTTDNGICGTCGQEIGGSTLTEKDYSYTFTKSTISANGTVALNGINWTSNSNSTYWGYDGTKGQQFGSSKNLCSSLTLESEAFSNIKKIVINTSGASSTAAKLTVKVGTTTVKTINLTASATEYEIILDTAISGEITLSYSQSAKKAIYIKSISVTYAE